MRNTISSRFTPVLPLIVALFLVVGSASATGPKFQVIHQFAGGSADGSAPATPLLLDRQGNLFGVTIQGGGDTIDCAPYGCGTAFELLPRNGRWPEKVLYSFFPLNANNENPVGALATDPAGNLYGIEQVYGDPPCYCGSIYQLSRNGGVWTQNVLHNFLGPAQGDGAYPYSGLVQDTAGNLYGATQNGAANTNNAGTVFQLQRNTDGSWTYNILYQFGNYPDAGIPFGPMAIDPSGNLYGTSLYGGEFGYGAVYKLSRAGGSWTETVLFNFTSDFGGYPNPFGVTVDSAGNLYGVTLNGGAYNVGTIYKLTPSIGFWNRTVLHTFTGSGDGAYPYGGLAIDASGALYGSANYGGSFGYGNVYKLTLVNGKWQETVLHEFTNGNDGAHPSEGLTLDHQGNVFGTTQSGGAFGDGVAFEITP